MECEDLETLGQFMFKSSHDCLHNIRMYVVPVSCQRSQSSKMFYPKDLIVSVSQICYYNTFYTKRHGTFNLIIINTCKGIFVCY